MLQILGTCAFALTTLASPLVLHEAREWPLKNVVERQRIEPHALLPMRIALAQKGLESAESWLLDVSDPTSGNYGKHWSQSEVIDAFKPTDQTVDAVMNWLLANDIEEVTHTKNKQWLAFDLPAQEAENLFNTEYFEHINKDGDFEASCDKYYIPQHLRAHIDFITPALKGSVVSGRTVRSRNAALGASSRIRHDVAVRLASRETLSSATACKNKNCSECATPGCIRTLYDVSLPNPRTPVSSQNHLGIFERGTPCSSTLADY